MPINNSEEMDPSFDFSLKVDKLKNYRGMEDS